MREAGFSRGGRRPAGEPSFIHSRAPGLAVAAASLSLIPPTLPSLLEMGGKLLCAGAAIMLLCLWSSRAAPQLYNS